MKSYFFDGLHDEASARIALSQALPNWVDPWLLKDEHDDVMAFFNVNNSPDGSVSIQADLSGRHHGEGEAVIRLLILLKGKNGGVVTDDDDNII